MNPHVQQRAFNIGTADHLITSPRMRNTTKSTLRLPGPVFERRQGTLGQQFVYLPLHGRLNLGVHGQVLDHEGEGVRRRFTPGEEEVEGQESQVPFWNEMGLESHRRTSMLVELFCCLLDSVIYL